MTSNTLAGRDMRSLRLPSTTQMLVTGALWFVVSVAFQAEEVYRSSHYFNITDTLVSALLMLLAVVFIFTLQRYTSAYINNIFTRIGLLAVLIFKIIFLQGIIVNYLLKDAAYDRVYHDTMIIRIFASFLVLSFYSFIFWFLFHIKKLNDEALMKQSSENSLREAELMKLRQQIQPHFLFNSLNSINALVVTEPARARNMIQNLSDFLRGTMKKDENRFVPLREEMDLLKLYLDIEKVRFGHRLKVNFNIDDDLYSKNIPPLMLQPLVENAIKFGLYNLLDEVEINIIAKFSGNILELEVNNPFDENTASTRKGEGFGLSLIRRRLQLTYHRADLLKTEKSNGIFKATVYIPQ
jgi:sensor histidine kinase YesM